MSRLIKYIERCVPNKLLIFYRQLKAQFNYHLYYSRSISDVRKKKTPLNIVFFVVNPATWKYDVLYKMLENDDGFHPMILVCPIVNKGRENMLQTLQDTYSFFREKGYDVICSYNEDDDSYIDALSLHPDIIFYTNPYKGLIDDRYYIDKIKHTLTCYVNYAYTTAPYKYCGGLPFHNLLWKYFIECEDNKKQTASFSYLNGINCCVSGYPIFDEFELSKRSDKDWKLKNPQLKRIIWAPHHTIEGQTQLIQFSTFLLYSDYMLQIADEYKEKIQVIFKPHPLLRVALYQHPLWGKEKTDAYYLKWKNGENTSFLDGDYTDAFLSSDAMIHDCGSFIVEYLYTQNPVMYLANFDRKSQANKVGAAALDCHYLGTSKHDIRVFIDDVVNGKVDELRDKRKEFFEKYILPPNGGSASRNILNEIKRELRVNK